MFGRPRRRNRPSTDPRPYTLPRRLSICERHDIQHFGDECPRCRREEETFNDVGDPRELFLGIGEGTA